MSGATPTKRFIAGATCPSCGAVDKVYVLKHQDGARSRHCTRCDLDEQLVETPAGWEPVRLAGGPATDD